MKTLSQIKRRIAELEADERLQGPQATVFENAPLALIQLELEAKIVVLKWVISKEERKTP